MPDPADTALADAAAQAAVESRSLRIFEQKLLKAEGLLSTSIADYAESTKGKKPEELQAPADKVADVILREIGVLEQDRLAEAQRTRQVRLAVERKANPSAVRVADDIYLVPIAKIMESVMDCLVEEGQIQLTLATVYKICSSNMFDHNVYTGVLQSAWQNAVEALPDDKSKRDEARMVIRGTNRMAVVHNRLKPVPEDMAEKYAEGLKQDDFRDQLAASVRAKRAAWRPQAA